MYNNITKAPSNVVCPFTPGGIPQGYEFVLVNAASAPRALPAAATATSTSVNDLTLQDRNLETQPNPKNCRKRVRKKAKKAKKPAAKTARTKTAQVSGPKLEARDAEKENKRAKNPRRCAQQRAPKAPCTSAEGSSSSSAVESVLIQRSTETLNPASRPPSPIEVISSVRLDEAEPVAASTSDTPAPAKAPQSRYVPPHRRRQTQASAP